MNLPEEMEAALQKYEGLNGLKKIVPQRESLTADGIIFNALSDPIRLSRSFMRLRLSTCAHVVLKEITEMSDSKLSYHLNVLEDARLIVSGPKGSGAFMPSQSLERRRWG